MVELDGARVEATLDGPIFVMENADQPGVVGAVGPALANAGVNVNRIHLAKKVNGDALSIWSINQMDDGIVKAVSSVQHVSNVIPVVLP